MTETWAGLFWAAGGYLVGTIPSAWLVTRARGGTEVFRRARRSAGELDAHMLMTAHLGGRWSAVAATADVVKALGYVLAARLVGPPPAWVAVTGAAVVVGYGWPPWARSLAGRGLAVASGVYLALLPIPMAVMGGLILLGAATMRDTSMWSTAGLLVVPVLAAILGRPGAYVAKASAIFLLIMLRRLEGVGEVIRRGIPAGRAVWYRVAYDSSGPKDARVIDEDAPPERAR